MQEATRAMPIASQKTKIFLFVFLSVITLAPLTLVHSQFITGPLVNAMLILTCALVGPVEALVLSLFPSPVALMSGLLPLPLAPMIPFIMIGNALYVLAFYYICGSNPSTLLKFGNRSVMDIVGVLAGSVLKFAFLTLTVQFVMGRMLAAPLVANLAVMMSWPQLITAVLGGFVAIGLLSYQPQRG